MSKIWVIGDAEGTAEQFIKSLSKLLLVGVPIDTCPPQKTACGKVYEHGCYECWGKWIEQNVEVISDE